LSELHKTEIIKNNTNWS
jgi:hypothetical protein